MKPTAARTSADLPEDARPVTALPNLGPAMARLLEDAGYGTVRALHEAGSDQAYRALLDTGHRPHFMAYLALTLALQGRPLSDCPPDEKAQHRARFDALCARPRAPDAPPSDTAPSALAAELDRLGVRFTRKMPQSRQRP